ncbi:hypothetical protein F3087_24350 [Nocardia colli]|uniref:Uncharacterized protein n=1 Tax=Nocardia colli TaxID=2545717 RepID=A0A5N0EG34_9NOCA|nr:hypothetical protein [Nocardia colli]KAA8886371.1 hypothetical protein F3087_24350 [Nocardia colli]
MSTHEHWYLTYERDVLGAPGKPWPTKRRSTSQPESPAAQEPPQVAEKDHRGSLLNTLRAACRAVTQIAHSTY